MRLPEYDSLDALGLADLVRRKDVTPVELTEAAIERIEQRNPALNAVIHPMFDDARRAARASRAKGAFAGVPVLLKDLGAAYAGVPLSEGSRFLRGHTPAEHSELVRRFLASGVIVVGKTNTPELGLMPVTEPEAFGPARNPWDPTRTPGGSSGGSAVAVAARMVPLASGGDGGGSIRIPASCCGIFGFKPSRGRMPTGPDAADPWQGFAIEHVLTVSVRDSAAMLDVTQGADAAAYHHAPQPARSFLEEAGTEPGRLRIAWSAAPYLSSSPIAAECRQALAGAVELLKGLGHELIEDRPAVDARRFTHAFVTMIAGEVSADIRDAERRVGRAAAAGDFEDGTWLLRELGRTFGAGDYVQALRELKTTPRRIARFMADRQVDVLLSPTLATPPVSIGAFQPPAVDRVAQRVLGRLRLGRVALALGVLDKALEPILGFVSFTPVFNASGQPSMSVPLHWTAAGLPIGVMLTARYGEDGVLFRLAGQLERARPWRDRRPPAARGPQRD
jgi:amidase